MYNSRLIIMLCFDCEVDVFCVFMVVVVFKFMGIIGILVMFLVVKCNFVFFLLFFFVGLIILVVVGIFFCCDCEFFGVNIVYL